jgi:hypothetical protein
VQEAFGLHVCPIGPTTVLKDPLPDRFFADNGFEETGFFNKGVGAGSLWGAFSSNRFESCF